MSHKHSNLPVIIVISLCIILMIVLNLFECVSK